MTNLDSIIKSREITLPTKGHLVKAMVFPVVMYGCESWTMKKAERRRIDAFELWCWRRFLKRSWRGFLQSPCSARRSNQSILKEINLEYSPEGLMLKLKLQDFGPLMQRADSLGKTLMPRETEGRRKRGQQRMIWLDGITKSIIWVWASSRRWWRTRKPSVLQSVGCKESDTTSNWTTTLFHQKSPTEYRKDKNCSVAFSSLPPPPPVSLIFQQVFNYS